MPLPMTIAMVVECFVEKELFVAVPKALNSAANVRKKSLVRFVRRVNGSVLLVKANVIMLVKINQRARLVMVKSLYAQMAKWFAATNAKFPLLMVFVVVACSSVVIVITTAKAFVPSNQKERYVKSRLGSVQIP